MENNVAIFKDRDMTLEVPVATEENTEWLNLQQMATFFDRDVKTIGKHINKAVREELEGQVVVAKLRQLLNMVLYPGKHRLNRLNITI